MILSVPLGGDLLAHLRHRAQLAGVPDEALPAYLGELAEQQLPAALAEAAKQALRPTEPLEVREKGGPELSPQALPGHADDDTLNSAIIPPAGPNEPAGSDGTQA